MPELCPRCQAPLPTIEGASAAFCAVCGLQQLRVPTETLETATADAGTHPASIVNSTHGVEWQLAFRVLAVATAVGAVPCLLKPDIVMTGGANILALLLLPLLTLGSAAAYLRRRPFPPFTPAMGARIGVVLALLLAAVLAAVCGLAGFVGRYGMHSTLVQTTLDLAFRQMDAQMAASATPLPLEWSTALHWPEIRAAAFLLGQAITSVFMLAVGAGAGAVAGALLGARQRRSRT